MRSPEFSPEQSEKEPTMERHKSWTLSKIKELSEKHPKLVRGIANTLIAAPAVAGMAGGAFASYGITGRPDAAVMGAVPGGVGLGVLGGLAVRNFLEDVAKKVGIDVEKLYKEDTEDAEVIDAIEI